MKNEQKPIENDQEKEPEGTDAEQDPVDNDAADTEQESGELTDKHGEPAINKGRHNRIVAEKDARIAELEKQVQHERTLRELDRLGCIDAKSAMYRLEEFGGDTEKLKAECPHLFKPVRQVGSTGAGARRAASGNSIDAKIDRAFHHR